MSELDKRKHRDVFVAMVSAALGPDPDTDATRIYDYGKVPGADGNPGTLPRIYVLISVSRRPAPGNKSGSTLRSGWRVSFRYVGHTVDEALWADHKIASVLDPAVVGAPVMITVDGSESSPLIFESDAPVAPDDGLYSGFSGVTYSL